MVLYLRHIHWHCHTSFDFRFSVLKFECSSFVFMSTVGEVSFVELFSDDNDKPRGCGIIEFENPTVAKKAIEKMHRYELSGRKIVVKEVCKCNAFLNI